MFGWRRVVALPEAAELSRALRALRQTVPSAAAEELDETATAERSADDPLWLPVRRRIREPRWDLVLVIDDSPSMVVWRHTVAEFANLLLRLSTFRSVRQLQLNTNTSQGSELRLSGMASPSGSHSPGEVRDPARRRIILVLSDGMAPAWHRGEVGVLLHSWARTLPVAVVHLQPQHLWAGTGIHPHRLRLHTDASGVANVAVRWTFREPGERYAAQMHGDDLRPAIAVPVLELDGRWLRQWTRLVVGETGTWVDLPALLTLPTSSPVEPADEGTDEPDLTPAQRVSRFRASVSPTTFNLAKLLAAAWLNLPTMELIQGAWLPQSRTWHLAELLNSRIVRPCVAAHKLANGELITFDFDPGVRQEILGAGRRGETLRVFAEVGSRVGPIVGGRRIGEVILDSNIAINDLLRPATLPYLEVGHAILRAVSGHHHLAARQLEKLLEGGRMPTSASSSANRFPASPAILGNVPPRNPIFTGRDGLLKSMHDQLAASGTMAVLPHTLQGTGGVGKSQVAVEYVYRHLNEYDLIWWIPAERPAQIAKALVELAQRMGLAVTREADDAVPDVLEALRTGRPYSNWLLVYDNAEHPGAVARYLPPDGPGRILVTSRNAAWAAEARTIEVDIFQRAESIELLRRRAPELSEASADRLAEALSDLPLAVAQAAAWQAATAMSPDDYLHALAQKRAELTEAMHDPDYPVVVAAAWNVSLDHLGQTHPAAVRLLQVCAFFAPEPVARQWLVAARRITIHPELDPVLHDPTLLGRAIREINRYALARIDPRTSSLQMHRLVQRALIERMTEEERTQLRQGAQLLLAANDRNDPKSPDTWSLYAELYPHIVESRAIESTDYDARRLVINEGEYLFHFGELNTAVNLATDAFTTWRTLLGDDHDQTIGVASKLDFYLYVVGRYPESKDMGDWVYQATQRFYGPDHEDSVKAMGGVAADRRAAGDFAGALELSEQVWHKYQEILGSDERETLNAANNLAVSLRLTSDFARARELDEDTWARKLPIFGADDWECILTQDGLLIDRRELGDVLGVQATQEEMVDKLRQGWGETNPLTLRALRSLSVTRRKAGDLGRALELSRAVYRRLMRRYGDNYPPDTLTAGLSQSIDLRHNGLLDEAHEMGVLTRDRAVRTFGPDHPHTVCAEVNLATIIRRRGDAASALANDREALEKLRQTLGDTHLHTLSCQVNLATDLAASGDHATAVELGEQALESLRARFGEDHPTTLVSAANLSGDLAAIGHELRARTLRGQAATGLLRTLYSQHPLVHTVNVGGRVDCDLDLMSM